MKSAQLPIAMSLLALVVWGCSDADNPDCEQICAAVATCKMLPSALGIVDDEGVIRYDAIHNCEHRCSASSTQTIQQLRRCIDSVKTDSAATETWCASGCTEIASCLEQAFGDPRIVGSGRVQVEFGMSSADAVTDALTCENGPVEVGGTTEFDAGSIAVFCEMGTAVIESVEVLLENHESSHQLVRGGCSDILSTSFTSDVVPVGRYQLAIQLFRGGECHKFYGENVQVAAGGELCEDDSCIGTIPLPAEVTDLPPDGDGDGDICEMIIASAGVPCEGRPEDCSDENDNDCDGFSDCNDPSCMQQCQETGTRCNDGEDNDNDQLIDCEDPDCESEPVCELVTSGTGSGTGTETDTGAETGTTG